MSVLRSLPVVHAYVSVHSSLVIGMLIRPVRLKECGLGTQSLGLYWPLSEVGTRLEQQICSSPHCLIIRACLPGPETEHIIIIIIIITNKAHSRSHFPTKSPSSLAGSHWASPPPTSALCLIISFSIFFGHLHLPRMGLFFEGNGI